MVSEMQKIIFTSDELPAGFDDRARFSLWRDMYNARYGDSDMSYASARPFAMRSEFARVDEVGLARVNGTVDRMLRTSQHVARDGHSEFQFGFNQGATRGLFAQRGRELVFGTGQLSFLSTAEARDLRSEGGQLAWIGICIARERFLELVPGADDLVARPFDQNEPAVRHLARYLDFIVNSDEIGDDPALASKVSTTLRDLAALALGAGDDVAEIARRRGLRAARVQEIIAELGTGFANPAFSARHVGLKLGLSPRYVQELLQETDVGFTARVLELRLRKARAMLADARHDRLKVSDIALACGFNDVSYFNRCFRRRFGASPTQLRGTSGE
jgi:AraC-like DNA-binding protein